MKHVALISMTIVAVLAAMSGTLIAQQDVANLQKALDKSVDINIANIPIGQVFQKISTQTGAKFVLSEDAIAMLPYGDQTPLEIKLRDTTLRNSLSPMLSKLALQWTIEGDKVKIVPKEALYRLGRRATFNELVVLGTVCSRTLKPVSGGGAIAQLQEITGRPKLRLVFSMTAETQPAIDIADKALPCTAAQWLDALCANRGWTWYLQGDDINVIEQKAQLERQLNTVVSVRYVNEDLMGVLLDLAKRARIQLTMEPGVLDLVPADKKQNFNLSMSEATVSQALEVVAGATGLKFVRTGDGVRVEASDTLTNKSMTTTAPAARRRAPFFLKMNIRQPNGMTVEVYVSPDELPPALVDYIQAEKNKYVDEIMKTIPIPASMPAATPDPSTVTPVVTPASPTPPPTKSAEPAFEGGNG